MVQRKHNAWHGSLLSPSVMLSQPAARFKTLLKIISGCGYIWTCAIFCASVVISASVSPPCLLWYHSSSQEFPLNSSLNITPRPDDTTYFSASVVGEPFNLACMFSTPVPAGKFWQAKDSSSHLHEHFPLQCPCYLHLKQQPDYQLIVFSREKHSLVMWWYPTTQEMSKSQWLSVHWNRAHVPDLAGMFVLYLQ